MGCRQHRRHLCQLAPLGASGGTFDTNGNNVTLAGIISGTGGLAKPARAR